MIGVCVRDEHADQCGETGHLEWEFRRLVSPCAHVFQRFVLLAGGTLIFLFLQGLNPILIILFAWFVHLCFLFMFYAGLR